jgi:hypothetical protein
MPASQRVFERRRFAREVNAPDAEEDIAPPLAAGKRLSTNLMRLAVARVIPDLAVFVPLSRYPSRKAGVFRVCLDHGRVPLRHEDAPPGHTDSALPFDKA